MDIAKHWRQRASRYRLEGQRHRTTGEVRFPAQSAMPGEDQQAWEPHTLSGKGELYSFSMQHQAATGYAQATPYLVALVRLAEGPLITAQLTDCAENDVQIGMQVEMVTRRLKDSGADGVLIYGYKFRPVL